MYPEITKVSINPNNLAPGKSFVLSVKVEMVDKLKRNINYFYNSMPSSISATALKFNKTTTKTTKSPDSETYRYVCSNIKYSLTGRTQGNIYIKKD